jgi:hypothetical protein
VLRILAVAEEGYTSLYIRHDAPGTRYSWHIHLHDEVGS